MIVKYVMKKFIMYKVRITRFVFDPLSRMCEQCRRFSEEGVCPECQTPYDMLTPWWHAHLTMQVERASGDIAQPGEISGSVMDNVMGMTIFDYYRLKECYAHVDLDNLVSRYFIKNVFIMRKSGSRVSSISLLPGCQLTFRVWLGLQPGFETAMIEQVVEGEITDDQLWIDDIPDGDEIPDGLTKDEINELLF